MRLNDFQLLMRGWAQLGAYNAGQVMQVSGKAEIERWQWAVEAAIHEIGLGIPQFGPGRFEVQFIPVDAIPVTQVQGPFETFISQEINRRFEPTDLPIRFWVLPREDGTYYFGAFYDHWIADSRAMRDLMHRIFVRYRAPDAPPNLPPLTMYAPPFRTLFRKHLGRSKLWGAERESIRNVRRHLFVHRVNLADPLNFTARCLYIDLPAGLITRIHRHAKAHGASVNDAFLAVLGEVRGYYTAGQRYRRRRHGRRRNRISLGTIVDIRDAAAQPLDTVFGLYLSSYVTILREPENESITRLMELIARATRKVKRTFAFVRVYSGLEVARFWWDTYGGAKWKAQMIHKNVPVAA